jgi:hypothetical protein
MEKKVTEAVPVTPPKEPAVRDEESLGQVHEGDLISLGQIDGALAAKMHLVNNVCVEYYCEPVASTCLHI